MDHMVQLMLESLCCGSYNDAIGLADGFQLEMLRKCIYKKVVWTVYDPR